MLGRIDLPGGRARVAWLAVPPMRWPGPTGGAPQGKAAVVLVAIVALIGAALSGGVTGLLRALADVRGDLWGRRWSRWCWRSGAPRPRSIVGVVVDATLFFALANAILLIPLLLPSGLMGTGGRHAARSGRGGGDADEDHAPR